MLGTRTLLQSDPENKNSYIFQAVSFHFRTHLMTNREIQSNFCP